jgi:small subunit ribosomal protein S1
MNQNPIDPAFEEPVQNAEDTSFGDILSQFEQEQHEQAEIGQPLEGTVVVIHEDFAFIDIGRKTEGIVPIASLKEDNGEISVKAGDKLFVNVVGRNQEGY